MSSEGSREPEYPNLDPGLRRSSEIIDRNLFEKYDYALEQIKPENLDCLDYFANKCQNSNCKFRHSISALNSTEICMQWRYAKCELKDKCRYRHVHMVPPPVSIDDYDEINYKVGSRVFCAVCRTYCMLSFESSKYIIKGLWDCCHVACSDCIKGVESSENPGFCPICRKEITQKPRELFFNDPVFVIDH